MSTTGKGLFQYFFLTLFILIIIAAAFVLGRNYLVQKTYRGQVQDIKAELKCYKELNDTNVEMWSADIDLKKTSAIIESTKKLSPASKELKESKMYLLQALNKIYLAQKESGLTVSELNLETDAEKFALPKKYLDEANTDAAHSTESLGKFEETNKQLFQ